MGKFSDMRKKQLEARGAGGPASVRPPAAAPQAEPIVTAPQAVVPQTAPAASPAPAEKPAPVSAPVAVPVVAPVAAPVAAPVSAPVPVAPSAPAPVVAPVASPPPAPVSAPVPAPLPGLPAPFFAPVSAPAGPSEKSSGEIPIESGDVDILSLAPIGASSAPDLLAGGLPPEAGPVDFGPEVSGSSESPASSLQPAAPSVHPSLAAPRRTVRGMLHYDAPGDNGFLATGYKLMYRAAGATSCTFSLFVKDKELPELLTLELDTPRTVAVPTKNGDMTITLTYKGANDVGRKQVEYAMEGGVETVTGVMESFRKAGAIMRSAGRKLLQHMPEVVVVGLAAGLAVCGFSMDWIRNELGRLHPYVTAAVPAVIAAVAIWSGFEREKIIKKEMENSD